MLASVARAVCLSCIFAAVVPALALAADENVRVELNAAQPSEGRCLLTFVAENKVQANLDVLKLDLVVFNTEGVIQRRLLAEMGPLRGGKTMVRTYPVDIDCPQIGSLLVNEIAACTPGERDACLDGLGLASRVAAVRFYK